MRVIAGSARRLRLITLEGLETRPTGDKIKETLFNILQFGLPDTEFLDLFSGSGAIAIEALSRGAARAVLVENNRRAAECIRTNLETTHFTDKAELMLCDVMTAISTGCLILSIWIRRSERTWRGLFWNGWPDLRF